MVLYAVPLASPEFRALACAKLPVEADAVKARALLAAQRCRRARLEFYQVLAFRRLEISGCGIASGLLSLSFST